MTTKDETTVKISALTCEVSPEEVDAGADMTLMGTVSCSPARDLRGRTLLIKDQDGTVAESIELTAFDGETNQTRAFAVKAPVRPGAYTWLAVCPSHAEAGLSYEQRSAPFSFSVKPHSTQVVVWDAPSTIECGENFSIKFGVKCSAECRPDGWALEVRDHEGTHLARATLSDTPWPETAALYHAKVDLTAPDTEGLYAWEAKATVAGLDVPHVECLAGFRVRVVPTPDCVLTVEAMDMESQTPVKGAKVVVHPYRAFTDECGVARVRVPKGEYRLFVSGKNHVPFRRDAEVKTDMTITAELVVDVGLTDADIWS